MSYVVSEKQFQRFLKLKDNSPSRSALLDTL